MINGFFQVSQSLAEHLSNLLAPTAIARAEVVGDALITNSVPQWFSEIIGSLTFAPSAAELAVAGVGQDIVNAIQEGNSSLALSDPVSGPSTILDAILNGYNLGDGGGVAAKLVDAVPDALRSVSSQRLLSNEGTVETIREAMETIARDIPRHLPPRGR